MFRKPGWYIKKKRSAEPDRQTEDTIFSAVKNAKLNKIVRKTNFL